jgi:hypothetical protein
VRAEAAMRLKDKTIIVACIGLLVDGGMFINLQ